MQEQEVVANNHSLLTEISSLVSQYEATVKQVSPQEKVIIEIGVTNAGKTSLMYYLAGLDLQCEEDTNTKIHKMKFRDIYKNAEIGDTTSTTNIPNIYLSQDHKESTWDGVSTNFCIVDTPGLNDFRKYANIVCNSITFEDIFSRRNTFQKFHIVLVVPYEEMENIETFLKQVSQILNPQIFHDSQNSLDFISVVVTKVEDDQDTVQQLFVEYLELVDQQLGSERQAQSSSSNSIELTIMKRLIQFIKDNKENVILTFSNEDPKKQEGVKITRALLQQRAFIPDLNEKGQRILNPDCGINLLFGQNPPSSFESSMMALREETVAFQLDTWKFLSICSEMASQQLEGLFSNLQSDNWQESGGESKVTEQRVSSLIEYIDKYFPGIRPKSFTQQTLKEFICQRLDFIRSCSNEDRVPIQKIIAKTFKRVYAQDSQDKKTRFEQIQLLSNMAVSLLRQMQQCHPAETQNSGSDFDVIKVFQEASELTKRVEMINRLLMSENYNYKPLVKEKLQEFRQRLSSIQSEIEATREENRVLIALDALYWEKPQWFDDTEEEIEYVEPTEEEKKKVRQRLSLPDRLKIQQKFQAIEKETQSHQATNFTNQLSVESIAQKSSSLAEEMQKALSNLEEYRSKSFRDIMSNKLFENSFSLEFLVFAIKNLTLCYQFIFEFEDAPEKESRAFTERIADHLKALSMFNDALRFEMVYGDSKRLEKMLKYRVFKFHYVSKQFLKRELIPYVINKNLKTVHQMCYNELIFLAASAQNPGGRAQQVKLLNQQKAEQKKINEPSKKKQKENIECENEGDFSTLERICSDQILDTAVQLWKANIRNSSHERIQWVRSPEASSQL